MLCYAEKRGIYSPMDKYIDIGGDSFDFKALFIILVIIWIHSYSQLDESKFLWSSFIK